MPGFPNKHIKAATSKVWSQGKVKIGFSGTVLRGAAVPVGLQS
jgi:hypothetical protein